MQKKLGDALRNARLAKRMTLREVEKVSKKKISNAHISLLESGTITFPHPHYLKTLAVVYDLNFLGLMMLAGYLTRSDLKVYR